VQVELHTRLKKVMVLRDRVSVAGDKFGATEDPERSNPNPIALGMTPGHMIGGATPLHGGATPMHGGATPMHDGMGGGFTPSHNSGGDDVWRPGGNIDQQPEDDEANGTMDASTGWGSAAESTPQQNDTFGSSTADTGGGWGSSNDQSSGGTWAPSDAVTENGGFGGGSSQEPPAAPATMNQYDTTTTTEIQPQMTNNNANTLTAVGAPEDNEKVPTWFMERVCVTIISNDAAAVIKEVNNSTAVVELLEDKSRMSVTHRDVVMTPPKEHDMVLVIGGADVGVESELVCVDGDTDAILKDSKEEFKIVEIAHLVKIISDP